jgi:hypothetical protein
LTGQWKIKEFDLLVKIDSIKEIEDPLRQRLGETGDKNRFFEIKISD